ncbi:non-ribosomal peptide synthetase [Synechocystis sp. PCC 7509]|uniref:non-ribosomal peptide synthetase n=1 Tax=Synechocystis sp. PCC 7509 TaxID=927677 RepID=UPI0002AC0EC0|nr:non-ribosomal peptide synthetase [Synechocystis sp. PCC 7509]
MENLYLQAEKLELLDYLLAEAEITSSQPTIAPRSSSENLPLSFAQQRLWFLNQLKPNSPFYNISAALRLKGVLNITALENSFNEIIRRHEVLRTAFTVVDGQPIQVVTPCQKLTIKLIDLTNLSIVEREVEVQKLAVQEVGQPFNLGSGLLVRSTLLRLGESEHILVFAMHHIVSDGWSIDVLVQEVATLYECYCNGKPSPLPDLTIQYADYAVWQRQYLQGEVLERQLDYWKQQLGSNLPVLELPTDRSRSHSQSFRGASQSFYLPQNLVIALKSLSQQESCTLFMTFLAAFQVLLSRYAGMRDIVIGTPIANRDRTETERLIGFFVNTLVLRTDLSDNPSFRELLKRVRETTLGAYDHQDLPFDLLVEALNPQRDLSHTPLFQVMFVWQNTSMSQVELSGLTWETVETDSKTAKFDLTLLMDETELGLRGALEYNTDLFEATTISRMVEHLQIVLEGIVANPSQSVSQIPLTPQLDWNFTKAEYVLDRCIHELFSDRAAQTPEAVAVVFADKQLTYKQLNTQANQLAHYLQKLGVRPDSLVGICVERSLEMVVGLLGILKAGGAYLPLDPDYPQERLAFMLEDAGISILLTQERLANLLPEQAQVICLDSDWEEIAQASQDNLNSTVQPENIAYAIYTSGSTGVPKAVMIPHRAICNHMLWMQGEFPLTPADCVLQKTPFSFDASVWEFYAPLLAGGKLLLAQPGGHQDNTYLVDLIAAQQVTILQLVPTQLGSLLEDPRIAHCQSLRRVFCGGEVLTTDLQQRFFSCLPKVELYNLYGPTEATIDTTFWRCQFEDEYRVVPIGNAIANVQVYVLDSYLQLVPVGVAGEIYIGGDSLARCYGNFPDLTAQKFIPHPFATGKRLYKTGDLGRYRTDGALEFLGRIDSQVKLRGFRIELGEIEAQLGQHPNVKQNVAIIREDVPSQQRLVAYIIARQPSPTVSELRSFLKQRLPDYTIPAIFIFLDVLPLLPNGKIDRNSLPLPDLQRSNLEFTAPRNSIEATLVQIWSQVLQIENIGVDDNFFELGGDSILSLQVIAKANQAGLQLSPKQIFEEQTIAQLAKVASTTTVLQAEQGLVTGSLPLTPIQHWFFEQELTDLHHWNQAVMLEVPQTSDRQIWEQVVQKLLEHHDVLRSHFTQTASICPSPANTPPFTVVDLSALPVSQQKQAIETTAATLQASLNLSGQLVKVVLFQLGREQPSRLLAIAHHLIIDGVSWRILLEDLQTAYQQLSHGQIIELPAKTTSFKQWAEQLRIYAQSSAVESERDYWLSQAYLQPLPVDFTNGENIEATAATVSVSLSQQETQALLQEIPAAYQTQINDVLLTALVQAFSQWTGVNSLLIDLEGHGREDIIPNIDLSRTIGWFTTIFPVYLHLESNSAPETALKTIKEQLRSIPHRGINYGVLRYLCRDEGLQALPQAEVKFNYLGQFDRVLSIFQSASESSGLTQSPRGKRNCLLEINGLIIENQLRLNWTYSQAVHQHTTVTKLAESFISALRSLIAHCKSPNAGGYTPTDFPQMQFSQQELDSLIAELN